MAGKAPSKRPAVSNEPQVYCAACERTLTVKDDGRGFAVNIFKNKLVRACKEAGCTRPIPLYRAGVQMGGPAVGQG